MSFFTTFAMVRAITHAIRAGVGPFTNVTPGGRHIHHMTFGILGLLLVGYLWMLEVGTADSRALAPRGLTSTGYGAGAALTLDEFALWLNLARTSIGPSRVASRIDAVVLFGALLSIGVIGKDFLRELAARGATGARGRRRRVRPAERVERPGPLLSRAELPDRDAEHRQPEDDDQRHLESATGTRQPHQVTPGSRAWRAAGEMVRWLNTSWRIGSTA